MTRPIAKLHTGQPLSAQGRQLTVRGYLLFKEWDAEDEEFYWWEEWQISGAEQADTWIEVDHWAHAVYLYEPVRLTPALDPATIGPGQSYTLSMGYETVQATVTQTGYGTLEEVGGHAQAPLRPGEPMGYAELAIKTSTGQRYDVTIDSHAFRDMVAYRKRRLNARAQRDLLGTTVLGGPARPGAEGTTSGAVSRRGLTRLVAATTGGVLLYGLARSCVRATTSPSDDATSSSGGTGGFHYRSVYGGGGGGVGK